MALKRTNNIENFVRGADTFYALLALFEKNGMRIFLLWLAIWFAVFAIFFTVSTPKYEREAAETYLLSEVAKGLNLTSFNISLDVYKKDGEYVKTVESDPYTMSKLTSKYFSSAFAELVFSVIASMFLTSFSFYAAYRFFVRRGEKAGEDEKIRGADEVVSEEELIKKMGEKGEKLSNFKLANTPIPSRLLARNILASGSMGAGKSQLIFPLIDQAIDERKRCVFYDKTGEITATYFRPGIDILLNPFDERCSAWNIFNEVEHGSDGDLFASYFVPEDTQASDSFFPNSARALISDLLQFGADHGFTGSEFLHLIAFETLEKLNSILKSQHGLSKRSIDVSAEKQAAGVLSTITGSEIFRAMRWLKNHGEEFSIRSWFQKETEGNLFISSNAKKHESIKPLASFWINLVVNCAMSQKPDHTNEANTMLFLDEFGSLDKIRGVVQALTEARKFGLCTVIGVQNSAQIQKIYGKEDAQTIFSNLQNKAVLRVADSATAEAMSNDLGKIELEEVSGGQSFGLDSIRDSNSINRKRTEKNIVTTSEILYLPDLAGYIKLAGDLPVAKFEIEPKSRPQPQPDFLPIAPKKTEGFSEQNTIPNEKTETPAQTNTEVEEKSNVSAIDII